MKIKGVVTAGLFSSDGRLLGYKGDIPKELAELVAKISAANSQMAQAEAEAFSRLSQMKFSPALDWAVAVGEYAICMMGNYGALVKVSEAGFNLIFKELREVVMSEQ